MAKMIPAVYGEALFQTAVEKQIVDLLRDEAEALQTVWTDIKEFPLLLDSPKLSREEKTELVDEVFGNRFSEVFINFLKVLIERERQEAIPEICDFFLNAVNEYRCIGTAHVTSSTELNREQRAKIEARLLDTTQYRFLKMEYEVEEALIGGIIIRIGDRVVDGSVKARLEEIGVSARKARMRESGGL